MAQPTRKQREIQERESKILAVARDLFAKEGYHGLSMDRIAAELEYSKGTIYNHFPCKEEVLISLANSALTKRTEMFRAAASYLGNTRQRLTAVGAAAEVFVRCFPNHFAVEQLIRSSSVWDKTSEKRQSAMLDSERTCLEAVADIVRDAIVGGDLVLSDSMPPEGVVFGLWAMSSGAYAILATGDSLKDAGLGDPYLIVRKNMNTYLDGLGWLPDSTDFDYMEFFQQLQEEMMAEQAATNLSLYS